MEWDPDLYRGTAAYYADGRMPYPAEIATALRDALGLDGRGRLLDVGCGPGPVTRLLAPMFEAAVGVDPDPDMLAEAARRTDDARITWHRARGEKLPDGLGVFRVVTFAQSFHWMDRLLVARNVRSMIEPGGAWVHVGATTHQGVEGDDPLPRPRVPHAAIRSLIGEHLGSVRQFPEPSQGHHPLRLNPLRRLPGLVTDGWDGAGRAGRWSRAES